MTTTAALTDAEYDLADAIDLWLEAHDAAKDFTPSQIARGVRLECATSDLYRVLRWMEAAKTIYVTSVRGSQKRYVSWRRARLAGWTR